MPWLQNIVELPCPVRRGDRVADERGQLREVFEVRRLASLSSPIAGRRRPLYAVLHAGFGSLFVAVCLNGRQREWKAPEPAQKAKLVQDRKRAYTFRGKRYLDHRSCKCSKHEFCPQCERTWFPWGRRLRKDCV